MKKKWFLALIMFVCCLAFAVSDEVFNYKFSNGESIYMRIDDNNSLVYFDEVHAEMYFLFFSDSELDEMKAFAFECKLIAKKGNTLSSYETNKTYETIKTLMLSKGKIKETEYAEYYGTYVKGIRATTAKYDQDEKDFASGKKDRGNKLVVWSFTDEVDSIINNYYKHDHPKTDIDYTTIPFEQFPNRLDTVLSSGSGVPDVFALETAVVSKYIEMGSEYLLDLTDMYNEVKSKMVDYPAQVATHNGRVYALSWQSAPGAMFYRRSLAKKYLGTDDPDEVQKMFSDWNKFLRTARKLNEESFGRCVVVSTTGDLFMPFKGARKNPWVVNGKLVVDPAMVEYMKACKMLKDEGLEGRQGQWAEGWFAGMKGELRNENGRRVEVFSYFLPTWGLHYVLKPNAPATSGDWAMIPGPSAFYWGGTWIAAYKNTKNPNLAKEFIKYICTDDSFLERWAEDTGDLVANKNVIERVKYSYREQFLDGQNAYEEFAKYANNVDGSLTQATDQAIDGIFGECVAAYMNDEKSLNQALADFKQQVNIILGF